MKNPRTAWIVYIVLRLLFFAVPFAILYLLGLQPWLAAVFAALIGVALSVIFLARSRSAASQSIYDWRNRERTADDIVEDEAVDASEPHAGPAAPQAPETSATGAVDAPDAADAAADRSKREGDPE
ncbi:DUF4229 domain-containing protein [Leucobacter sp. USHLN153]|uniref:DUF4229 domain-containing protein n=1 Tax=Leucobacter sp. USHLN153 TaxID=3081268 RepID=UPI003015B90C